MLNINDVNKYYVRVSPLPEAQALVGQIVFVRQVSHEGIVLSMTNDCRPSPKLITLSSASNDNGWYDITDLVLDANASITPRYDICQFDNETAVVYRNYIDHPERLTPLDGRNAVGKLCFIGRLGKDKLAFSNVAYFVVSMDNRGFYIVYQGFCSPKKESERPKLVQKVVRLEGTNQRFYEASDVVTACNEAYHGDVVLKDQYVGELLDRVSDTTTEIKPATDKVRETIGLTGLDLT